MPRIRDVQTQCTHDLSLGHASQRKVNKSLASWCEHSYVYELATQMTMNDMSSSCPRQQESCATSFLMCMHAGLPSDVYACACAGNMLTFLRDGKFIDTNTDKVVVEIITYNAVSIFGCMYARALGLRADASPCDEQSRAGHRETQTSCAHSHKHLFACVLSCLRAQVFSFHLC
jgi:hypothetical protein